MLNILDLETPRHSPDGSLDMIDQDGLEWVSKTFGLEPRWTREPDIATIEQLVRQYLDMAPDAPCNVTSHAQGAFNKLYKVESKGAYALMRVALPVDPRNKTESEVATIDFVRQNTDMPVPKIFAFDAFSKKSCQSNTLGFEWILMEMLPGHTLRSRWRKMSRDAKQDLVKQVAKYQAQLFQHRFKAIGNLYKGRANSSLDEESQKDVTIAPPVLGQLVSMIFFWGDHVNQEVPRGPFHRSEDWIRSRLTLILADQEKILSHSEDEDDLEEAQDTKNLAERLLRILPDIFQQDENNEHETTILFHDDLSMQNILVDDHGKITGVIDWECVSALPLWRACQLPQFLEGRERIEEPQRNQYAPDDGEYDIGDKDQLDNEGANSLFWEHLMEWELTGLRKTFLEEMRRLAPEWVKNMEQGVDKADFEIAVQNCDNSWRTKKINAWLDARERGEKWSLRKKFFE